MACSYVNTRVIHIKIQIGLGFVGLIFRISLIFRFLVFLLHFFVHFVEESMQPSTPSYFSTYDIQNVLARKLLKLISHLMFYCVKYGILVEMYL